jgi:hypothetical protein
MIMRCSIWCKKTEELILPFQDKEYAVVIPTKHKDPDGRADCIGRFPRVMKEAEMIYSVPVGVIVG